MSVVYCVQCTLLRGAFVICTSKLHLCIVYYLMEVSLFESIDLHATEHSIVQCKVHVCTAVYFQHCHSMHFDCDLKLNVN